MLDQNSRDQPQSELKDLLAGYGTALSKEQIAEMIERFQQEAEVAGQRLNRDLVEPKPGQKGRQAAATMMPTVNREPFVQQFAGRSQNVYLRRMRYHQRRRSPKLPPIAQPRPSVPLDLSNKINIISPTSSLSHEIGHRLHAVSQRSLEVTLKLRASLNRIHEEDQTGSLYSVDPGSPYRQQRADPLKLIGTLSLSQDSLEPPERDEILRLQQQLIANNLTPAKVGDHLRSPESVDVKIKEFAETPRERDSLHPHPFELNEDDELASQHLEYVEKHLQIYDEKRKSSMASSKRNSSQPRLRESVDF